MAAGEGEFFAIVEGLTAMLVSPRLGRETVGAAAERLLARLDEGDLRRLRAEMARARDVHAIVREDERDPSIEDGQARARTLLAQAPAIAFEGLDLLAIRHRPGGGAAALAAETVARLGLRRDPGISAAAADWLTTLLGDALEAAGTVAERPFRRQGDEPDDEETGGIPWPLPFLANGFVEEHPEADEAALLAYLRRQLARIRKETAKTRRRLAQAGLNGPEDFMRMLGASEDAIAEGRRRRRLQEELERTPAETRVEPLLYDCEVELALCALARRHAGIAGDAGKPPLFAWLRAGMERRHALIRRAAALGDGARYAFFRASMPLSIADFPRAEAAVDKVAAMVAAGRRFMKPEDAEPLDASLGFLDLTPPGFWELQELKFLKLRLSMNTDPLKDAEALSDVAKHTMRRLHKGRADLAALLDEAAGYWSEAAGILTRDRHPRKWAALTHNLGMVHAARHELRADPDEQRAGIAKFDEALAALDPAKDAWTLAAIWSRRLGLAEPVPDI